MNPKLWLCGKAIAVGSYALAEKVRSPRVRTRDDVPVSGAAITTEWLTDVLCRDVPNGKVVSFSNPGGSSGTSERVALRVRYNDVARDAGLPDQLFTKATTSFRQRMVLGGAGALAGETQFYTRFRHRADIEAPRGFWGAVDTRSWRSIAVMEDIAATKGAKFTEPTAPFSFTQISDLVLNLARLHAGLWDAPDIADLKTPADYLRRTGEFLDIRQRCSVGMRRAHDVVPHSLLDQADRLYQATIVSMDLSTHNVPRTLLHGDSHAGQTYRTREGRMGLADWQAVLQGSWAFDFAYLVNSACEPDQRREWQKQLLLAYTGELAAHGGPTISYEDALLAYRQQSFWPYTAWAFTIGRAAYQPEMQPVPTCLAIIRRTAAAIDDLRSFEAVGL